MIPKINFDNPEIFYYLPKLHYYMVWLHLYNFTRITIRVPRQYWFFFAPFGFWKIPWVSTGYLCGAKD